MLHGFFSSSRRLLWLSPYLFLQRIGYSSISSSCISITSHYRARIEPVQFVGNRDELLDFLDQFLQKCIDSRQTEQIHTQIVLSGSTRSAFLAARLISVYAKLGLLDDARKVFETISTECAFNLLLWNSILRANISYGECEETLRLYLRMRNLGVRADGFTFPLVARACGGMADSGLCRIVHCQTVQMGLQNHLHVANELLGMYGKIGQMADAGKLFDRMPVRIQISWNTMISGFALNFDPEAASNLFRTMEFEGFEPNLVTWTSLLSSHARSGNHEKTLNLYALMRAKGIGANAESLAVAISVCVDPDSFYKGKAIHGYVITGGFEKHPFVKNSLIGMYGRHGTVKDAETLFSEIESKNIVSWNAMITCYAESGLCDEAFAAFSQINNGYSMVKPNVITWSAVLGGFASTGRHQDSLEHFRKMQLAKVKPNSITISSLLSVCAELSALTLGREIHGCVIRSSMDKNILVGNGLINMYTKCGSFKEGNLVFNKIENRDLFSWNTMISGYGMHGFSAKAIELFNRMIKDGLYKPDGVTFIAVLSACSHAGLVKEGRIFFNQMKMEFKIEPQVEHYACIVDVLGRAGFLKEAIDIVKGMHIEPNECVWGALLNSCRIHKNMDAARVLARVYEMNGGYYTLMSNIYAEDGKFEESARVRVMAKTKGFKKTPGQSWIEVKKKVFLFLSGNSMQTGMLEVYKIVEDLNFRMEIEGLVLDKNDIEDKNTSYILKF